VLTENQEAKEAKMKKVLAGIFLIVFLLAGAYAFTHHFGGSNISHVAGLSNNDDMMEWNRLGEVADQNIIDETKDR
jgi:hypothetical protein